MREIVYGLEPEQVAKMRWLTLGFLLATVVLDAASVVVGGPWWLVSVFTGIFAVGFGINWLGQRKASTQVDRWGIKARIFTGFYREAPWAEIEEITVRTRNRDEAVLVVLRDGTQFSLAAPINTGMFPDQAFGYKFTAIHEAWESAVGAQ